MKLRNTWVLFIVLCIGFLPAVMQGELEAADTSVEKQFQKHGEYIPLVKELVNIFESQPRVKKAYKNAIKHVKDLPPAPGTTTPQKNLWKNRTYIEFCNYFNNWYDFLATPQIEGLGYIEPFTHFYYHNKKAFDFLNNFEVEGEKIIFDWTVKFIIARGKFMDTPSKESKEAIEAWIKDPGTHIEDFIVPRGGYKTFNEFFIRELKPGARPIGAVQDDLVVVSPADSELNMINSVLTESSKIKTKGLQKLGVKDLLNEYCGWRDFLLGTALSCVLLPNNYHHYHAPVTGELIHSEIVPGIYNGIMDAPEWFHEGNVGDGDADFSIFEQFHRGIFIFRLPFKNKNKKEYAYVAQVVVGLNTISDIGFEMNSVNTLEKYKKVSPQNPVQVFKGEKLGYFKYGGSLNILLFQKKIKFEGVKVYQGQRIGNITLSAE